MKKRDRLTVIVELLGLLEEEDELPASRLATYVNMPYDRLKPILDSLVEGGFLEAECRGKARLYRLTGKGASALRMLREARGILVRMGVV